MNYLKLKTFTFAARASLSNRASCLNASPSIVIKKHFSDRSFSQDKKNLVENFSKTFGIGSTKMGNFYKKFGLNPRIRNVKTKYSTFQKVKQVVNVLTFRNTLENKIQNIRTFTTKELQNVRGERHLLRYPVRGQRTHTNGKTRKRLANIRSYLN